MTNEKPERPDTRKHFTKPSRTKQQFQGACDINKLVADAVKNGSIHKPVSDETYGDFANADDYKSAVDKIMQANADFMEIPSDVRLRLGNDPANLLTFINDPANLEEAVQLGLLEFTPDEVQAPAEGVAPPPENPPNNTPQPPDSGGTAPESGA